jgi:CheY-like chemotaxis protein
MVSAPVLQSALGSGHRRIAREAAVAVANIRPPAASIDDAGAVLPPLAEALSGRPIPRVLVIHESETFRTALVDLFRPLGFDAAPLDSGAAGLALARRQPPFDLILVSASLEDRLTDEIVDALKADPRTADAPVAVVIPEGEEATRYERLFGDKVIGFVGLPPEHEQIEAIVEGAAAARPSVDASTVEELATRAAAGLASLAGAPAALGWDVSAAVGPLAATLRDGTRPADLRIECAKALGSVVARGRGSSGAALKALAGALADPDEGVRAAAGAAIGRARRRP